ncbi:MAG: ATP-binding cassette domain-containing protein, partial [Myxococcota bacterium]
MAAQVHGLKKSFGDVVALDGVGFQISQSCVTAILGPNGAGKTTAIRILAGSLAADFGRAEVGGICVEEHPLQTKK